MCVCNNHGTCPAGYCICEPRWVGNNCQYSTEVEARLPGFMAYRFIFAVAFVVAVGYIGWYYRIIIRIHLHQARMKANPHRTAGVGGAGGGGGGGGCTSPSPQIICLSSLLLASIIRAFYYAIDPHSWRGVFYWQADTLLLNIPLVLILVAVCINLIMWMRLQIQFASSASKKFSLRFVGIQPNILKVIAICYPIMVCVNSSLYAAGALSHSVSIGLYNVVSALVIIYFITCVIYFGGKIMSYLKQNINMTTSLKGLLNMTKMVAGVSVSGGVVIVVLVLQTIAGCGHIRPGYCQVLYHVIYRSAELGAILFIVSAVTGSTGTRSSDDAKRRGQPTKISKSSFITQSLQRPIQ